MLVNVAQRWKPGVSISTHLLVAALLWSFIGIYLLVRGVLLYGDGLWWPPLLALLIGILKGHYLLARSARRNIERLLSMKDNSCLGAVYSLKMWLLVLLMMLGGRALRVVGTPEQWVALVYLAVGFALFLSSRLFWRKWRP
ncbi:MAG TPA: hypothetical protein ENN98_04195 [Desulfurivibrio alkaliphilus]|uniref:Uncharacterized protein n=1 Tax=Desulfurivibrio alkaliphilus TaxID=427923 RepID=A0A7C2TJH0_9BACT|nr:hypothetical protein [Desulfurivibrio alkaliphilus]